MGPANLSGAAAADIRPSKFIYNPKWVRERSSAGYLSILESKAGFYIYLYTYDVMHVMKDICRHQISRHAPIDNAKMQKGLSKEGEVFFKRRFGRQINFNSSSSLNTADLRFM
jgi:hypothetical protein